MDETQFWRLIETAKEAAGGGNDMDAAEEQATLLEDALSLLPPGYIIAFEKHLSRMLELAYRWDLWAAAYVINGGCSDDGFLYFRGWLVGRGKAIFEAAFQNPDGLVDVADGDVECEDLEFVAIQAYKRAAGKAFPEEARRISTAGGSREPSGRPWKDEDLPELLPLLTAKFSG